LPTRARSITALRADLEQPGPGVVEAAEALALAHGLDEHVLQQVFRGVTVGHLVAQETQKLTLVRLPGGSDAGEGAFRVYGGSLSGPIGGSYC